MGGTSRRIITALTAAASGNVTGSGAQFIQGAAVNYLQSLGAEKVKHIADHLKGEGQGVARAALHAVLACGGASAQKQNCSTAATGAAASVVLNNLLDNVSERNAAHLTQKQKQARENLITGLIAGITGEAGGDAAVANAAARIETENNSALLFMPSVIARGMPAITGAAGTKNSSDKYIEVSLLKKNLDLWGTVSEIAADAVNQAFNESNEQSAGDARGAVSSDEEKKPKVVTPEVRKHILDGDDDGTGGHRAGTGRPGKGEFPSNWSDDKIIGEVADVANDPKSLRSLGHSDRTVIKGTRDGIDIQVIVNEKGKIISAYPTNVRRNRGKPR